MRPGAPRLWRIAPGRPRGFGTLGWHAMCLIKADVTPTLAERNTRERFHDALERLGPVSGRLALLAFAIGLATLALLMILMLQT